MDLALLLIGTVLAVGSEIRNLINSRVGANIRSAILTLAKDLTEAMNNNNTLKEKLSNAYQANNANLVNELFKGAGFGPRANQLRNAIRNLDRQHLVKQKELSDSNSKLNNDLTRLSNAQSEAMTNTSGGNENATEIYNDVRQNIQGGIQTDAPKTPKGSGVQLTMPMNMRTGGF